MRERVESRAYAPLLRRAGEAMREWSRAGEVVVLAGTRAAADEFVQAEAGAGVLGVHRFTLAQFAGVVAGEAIAARGLSMLSPLGSEALAARAVHQLLEAGELGYFSPVAKFPGFARVLARTLFELRAQGVGRPGRNLAGLLAAYSGELADRGLADLPSVYELAAEGAHRLLGLPVICLDLDVRYRCEARFLEWVLGKAPRVLELGIGGDPGEGSALDRARGWLFSVEAPLAGALDGSVDFFSAPGEEVECVEIARRLLAMAGEGVAFDRVAIVLRDPARYQVLVEEALRRASIPAYFSHGSARPDPAGRAFLALLACANEGCSASRFAEYLSLGQVPGEEVDAPAQWEKLLVDAAVIGGPERWRRRLAGLREEFLMQQADDPENEWLGARLDRLGNLERFALPLIDRLGALPNRARWGDWIRALEELAEAGLRHPESALAVLDELAPMDEVGPVGFEEVYGVLEDRLRFFRREPEGRRHGRVFVCSIEEVRGRTFPVVFLPGLAEGIFPRVAREDPLLLDQARVALGWGLRTRDDTVAAERGLLVTAVAAAELRLIPSFPSMDTGLARPRVPSFYALEIARAVEGKLPALPEFRRRAAAGGETRLSWPAPADAGVAIDDAEFDLATLRSAMDQKGAARYLVDSNEHAARSLRGRWMRWESRWSGADGLVRIEAGDREVYGKHRLAVRAYSASALQQFAACPYRFALQAIFGLRPREEASAVEQLDPLTRGALFHQVQFRLFRRLGGQMAGALEVVGEVLAEVAEEYRERLAPAIPRVWAAEIEDLRTDLRAWLRELEADWVPTRFEYGFGLDGRRGEHDPGSSAEAAVIGEGYRIRGSMDLVEVHSRTGAVRIVDHKTGKAPEQGVVATGGGRVLQPLLYALAGEALWGGAVESGRLFYCTQRGGYRRVDIAVTAAARDRLAAALGAIDRAIEGAFLPAAPAEGECGRCDYRVVCGPDEEERVGRKDQGRLEGLVALRRIP